MTEPGPGNGTGAIGIVASRARRCSDWDRCLLGLLTLADDGEDIPEVVAPVGIIIVGSCAVDFLRGVTGRTGSEGALFLTCRAGIGSGDDVDSTTGASTNDLDRLGLTSSEVEYIDGAGDTDSLTGSGSGSSPKSGTGSGSGSASTTVMTSTSTTSTGGSSSSKNSATMDSLLLAPVFSVVTSDS